MARHGVSYMDVAKAANQLLGQGKNPTIEQIRRLLGTGSSTTLSQHLKRWKESQGDSQKLACNENLPEEFIALMKGLWERVIGQADEKVAQIEAQYQSKGAELEKELLKYKTNNQRWQQLHNQWMEEKNRLNIEKALSEKSALQNLKELATLNQKQELLEQKLQDKQDRLKELQRLHQHSQENLEHLRESTRTQRLVDQQRMDKEKQDIQKQVRELKEKYNEQKAQLKKLESQSAKLETQRETAVSKAEDFKKRYHETEERLKILNKQLNELLTETRIQAAQLTQINLQLQATLEKNKKLELERLELVKKKAYLEGQLQIDTQAMSA